MGSRFVELFEAALAQDVVKEFVREFSIVVLRSGYPFIEHHSLDTPHRFLFWNTGVGNAIEVPFQQLLLLLGSQLPIIWNAFVLAARDEIEKVFLQVCTGASNGMHFVTA